MAEMSNYCKAYLASELRQFPGWSETIPPLVVRKEMGSNDNPPTKADEAQYFFLHEDFTVTAGIFRNQQVTFNQVTDTWKEFCKTVLKFEPSINSVFHGNVNPPSR